MAAVADKPAIKVELKSSGVDKFALKEEEEH